MGVIGLRIFYKPIAKGLRPALGCRSSVKDQIPHSQTYARLFTLMPSRTQTILDINRIAASLRYIPYDLLARICVFLAQSSSARIFGPSVITSTGGRLLQGCPLASLALFFGVEVTLQAALGVID